MSLPLAFHQAGKGFLGPVLLIFIAFIVKQSIHLLINAAILSHPMDDRPENIKYKGTKSFESVAFHAFGAKAKKFTMGLLSIICFFTIVGYGVLLRDMLLPVSDMIFGPDANGNTGPSFHHNLTMLCIILLVTPLCTLCDLTPLESVGAISMLSIMTVAGCITYRSYQCNFSPLYADMRKTEWYEYINYVPSREYGLIGAFHDFLNALPIIMSVFMCHFNVLPVHNELCNPSSTRVKKLFASSIWGACAFYLFVGFSGSMYGNCTEDGKVEGNVLLSFDEDDSLLMIGRICLSLTITAAFPILVVPCRDVVIRALEESHTGDTYTDNGDLDESMIEPLLNGTEQDHNSSKSENVYRRKVISIAIFWLGAILASFVESIDIVWDILGGSLSLIMGFLLPSASFLVISKLVPIYANNETNASEQGLEQQQHEQVDRDSSNFTEFPDRRFACLLIFLIVPIMILLTCNAIYNIA